MPAHDWFTRVDQAFVSGTLEEHAVALAAGGLPAPRVALSLFVFFARELRLRGRGHEVARLLAAAPAVLVALGCPLHRLERSLAGGTLGRVVHELHDEGWPKRRIVAALASFSVLLDASGRDDEAVLAWLDRLTGFAARDQQLWPDEPEE
jgi:hypothetical protein